MATNASTFLALRYLRPKRSFVSVITIVSLLGVAVGVLMMVVVKSVMLGFDADFRETLLGAEPHLLLEHSKGDEDGWRAVVEEARKHPQVATATGYAGGILYARLGDAQGGFPVLGLDPAEAKAQLAKIGKHMVEGGLELAQGTVVISDYAAQQLGARLGDELSVYESTAVNRAARQFKAAMNETDEAKKKEMRRGIGLDVQKLKVAGIYRGETGGLNGYVGLRTGQALFHLGDGVTGVAIEVTAPYEARAIGEALCPNDGWESKTWIDKGESRLAAMRNEQIMMTVILWIIAVVAAFAVMNTTITVTMQKRREIGVLTALGCRTWDIIRIFVIKAAIIGGAGVVTGVVGSLLVLWLRNDLRALIARVTSSQVDAIEGVFLAEIPAQLSWLNVGLAAGGSFVLCLVAGFLPAWFAARLDPAVALRD